MHNNISSEEGFFVYDVKSLANCFSENIYTSFKHFQKHEHTIFQIIFKLSCMTTAIAKSDVASNDSSENNIWRHLQNLEAPFNTLQPSARLLCQISITRININFIKKFIFFFKHKKWNERWYTRILHKRNLCKSYLFFFRILSLKRKMMFEFVK